MKVTTWVQHSGDSHPFRSMSIEHPIPELWLFQNLNLKIKGQGHGWGHSWKSQCGYNIILTHISFVPCQSALPFLRYSIFKIGSWKSKVKWPWCCTTTGLDNSIELQMVYTIGFRDMGSAKSGPSAAWLEKFLAHGQAHMRQMGKYIYSENARACAKLGVQSSNTSRLHFTVISHTPMLSRFYHIHSVYKWKWGQMALV